MNKGMNKITQVYVIAKDITKGRHCLIVQQMNFLGTLSGTKPGHTIMKRKTTVLSEGNRKEFSFKVEYSLELLV